MKTVPFIKCECGQRGWDDEHEAEKALGRARSKRIRDMHGPSRRGMQVENRIFTCPLSGLLHLTAQSRRRQMEAA